MPLCIPGRHRVNRANVHRKRITPQLIEAYKHCCMTKGNENDDIAPDQEVNICTSCWIIIRRAQANPTVPVYGPENTFSYRKPVVNPNECFVCGQANPLFVVPFACRLDFFLKTNMFILQGTKCCTSHLSYNKKEFEIQPALFQIQSEEGIVSMTRAETATWMSSLREAAVSTRTGMLNRLLNLNDEDFRHITAVTVPQFHMLCEIAGGYNFRGLVCRPISLILLLMKLRNANYLNFLKALFRFRTKGNVSLQIRVARMALQETFVPHHLGPDAFPRPQALGNLNDLAKTLHLEPGNEENCIIAVDGTYVYIPKSSNFTVLKRSYSQHKGRHLLKMTVVVFPNGKILDIHGPYFCDGRNNDASTLRHNLSQDVSRLKNWLIPGDVIVVDRGYRDAVQFLERLGYQVAIPHCLPHGANQHPTLEANESRIVTKTRWIVECINGHISQVFQFFGRSIHAGNVPFIGDYFRIACALLNAFYDPITLSERSVQVGNRMLQLRNSSNHLMQELTTKGLLNFRLQRPWRDMLDEELEDFPKMSLDDLYDLTLGPFQIRMSSGYYGGQEEFRFKVYREEETLLRVKMQSRHSASSFYYVFIRFVPNGRGSESISAWYCACKTGARTVGMCSHICAILWYLCYARYEPAIRTPSTRNLDIILDAAERHGQMNVVDDV